MIFSTNAGEALPVRIPANSCCTTSSVFSIFSSVSRMVSSSAIMPRPYQNARNLYRAKAEKWEHGPLSRSSVQSCRRQNGVGAAIRAEHAMYELNAIDSPFDQTLIAPLASVLGNLLVALAIWPFDP